MQHIAATWVAPNGLAANTSNRQIRKVTQLNLNDVREAEIAAGFGETEPHFSHYLEEGPAGLDEIVDLLEQGIMIPADLAAISPVDSAFLADHIEQCFDQDDDLYFDVADVLDELHYNIEYNIF